MRSTEFWLLLFFLTKGVCPRVNNCMIKSKLLSIIINNVIWQKDKRVDRIVSYYSWQWTKLYDSLVSLAGLNSERSYCLRSVTQLTGSWPLSLHRRTKCRPIGSKTSPSIMHNPLCITSLCRKPRRFDCSNIRLWIDLMLVLAIKYISVAGFASERTSVQTPNSFFYPFLYSRVLRMQPPTARITRLDADIRGGS